MDRYNVHDRVGKGTYGVVFKANDKKTGDTVALKVISLNDEEGIPSTAVREIALLKFLRHNNIVVMHDVIHMAEKLVMVFEFLEFDLKNYLDACHTGLDLITVKSLLYQLLQGLAECHRMKVLHRDLKPANLLLTRSGMLKLADFGLARTFAMPMSALKHEIITVWYRGPELLLGEVNYCTEVDLWSVGCIFAEMVNGAPLFPGSSDAKQLQLIMEAMGSPDPVDWPEARNLPLYSEFGLDKAMPIPPRPLAQIAPRLADDPDGLHLLGSLLCMNPAKRISAEATLSHPFFADLKRRRRTSNAPRSSSHAAAAAAAAAAPAPHAHPHPHPQQPPQQQQGGHAQGGVTQVATGGPVPQQGHPQQQGAQVPQPAAAQAQVGRTAAAPGRGAYDQQGGDAYARYVA